VSKTLSHTELHIKVGQLIEHRENLATEIATIDQSIEAIHQIVTGTHGNKPKPPAADTAGRVRAPTIKWSAPADRDGDLMSHAEAALVFVERQGNVTLKEAVDFLSSQGDNSSYSTISRLVDKGELNKYTAGGVKYLSLT